MTAVFFISWIAFSTSLSVITYSVTPYLMILWVLIGPIVGIFVTIIFLLIFLYLVFPFLGIENKFKIRVTKSFASYSMQIICNTRVKHYGVENVPLTGKVVFYCNHKSRVDPLMITKPFKRNVLFTPKDELFHVPVFGDFLKSIGCEPIVRDDDKKTLYTIIKVIKKIQQGIIFVIFPEGTSKKKDSEELADTRIGAYKVALKAQADIIPITVIGSSKIAVNAPFKRTNCKVIYHKLIKYEDFKDMNTTELSQLVEPVINSQELETGDTPEEKFTLTNN
jgi:1-acyl-sn-glycerol-3-phosphate acyltransferase